MAVFLFLNKFRWNVQKRANSSVEQVWCHWAEQRLILFGIYYKVDVKIYDGSVEEEFF